MCIAIYKPKNKLISEATLAQCFKANDDGAGFLIAKDKKLIMKKGFFTFDEFYGAWKKYENEQALIHFRIKTHGDLTKDNCHPFMVNSGLGFIHNGVIAGFGKDNMSDTNHFNNEILRPLVAKYGNQILFEPGIKTLIENKIGYSKLAFLDRHGNVNLFNESKGVWDNEVWYSNSSYKPLPVYRSTNVSTIPSIQPKPKHRTVELGDLVILIAGVYDSSTKFYHHVNSIHEVVAINKDYTVDLMSEDTKDDTKYNFAYNVSYSKFDFLEIEPTKDNAFDDEYSAYDTRGIYTEEGIKL
jgi:hypothetical protein